MKAAAVEVKNLSKTYGGQIVFENLNFQLPPGGAMAIVGPSGCGKSTLLHILAGFLNYDQGRIDINPQDAEKSLMLQNFGLFPWKTALDNLELPLKIRKIKKAERNLKINEMLKDLGLAECAARYPGQLSGGQQQRLALGRALITKPDLLLLDEPFSSLDAINREDLQNLLAGLRRKYKLSYIITTHSIEEAAFLGQRILVMGGEPAAVIADFSNPAFGRTEARLADEYFSLLKQVRHSLSKAGIAKEQS